MNKYVVEFIGTFFLVFTVGMTVIVPATPISLAPIAIGSILMVMIYAGGHISGGHYNPAVTLAVFLRGKSTVNDAVIYIVVQLLAGIVAALVVGFFKAGAPVPNVAHANVPASLLAEFLFTFALAYVVLNAATARANTGNSFYGLAIGFTLMVAAFAIGSISGAAINPAVATGITVMGISSWANIWIYFVADFLGGAAAAGIFRLVSTVDNAPEVVAVTPAPTPTPTPAKSGSKRR